MSDQMIVVVFDTATGADQAVQRLKLMQSEGGVVLKNAAAIRRDANGEATFHETSDLGGEEGAMFGAVIGGVIGILGGPAGAVMGAALGGLTGGAMGFLVDLGFPDPFLEDVEDALKPDTSVLIAVVDAKQVGALTDEVSTLSVTSQLFKATVGADALAKIKAAEARIGLRG